MPLDLNPPAQDLGITRPHLPDKRWAHSRPVPMPVDQAQLELPHQRVDIKNTGIQPHIVFNRQRQPVEIAGGETKHGVDMLLTDIGHFRELRRTGQLDLIGYPRPLHPLVFSDLPQQPDDEQPQPLPSGQQPQPYDYQQSLPLDEPEQPPANAPPLRRRPVNGQ